VVARWERCACPRPLPAGRGGVFIEPHPARFGLPSRGNLATPACDGRRDRDDRQPLALVLMSHDPDAARGADGREPSVRSFGFSITVPITKELGDFDSILDSKAR
jgi:hypothetical protein